MCESQCQVNMKVNEIVNSTIGELDDIKTKLDRLSRNDLLASLSFLKEGVTELYISLEISVQFGEKNLSKKQKG